MISMESAYNGNKYTLKGVRIGCNNVKLEIISSQDIMHNPYNSYCVWREYVEVDMQ